MYGNGAVISLWVRTAKNPSWTYVNNVGRYQNHKNSFFSTNVWKDRSSWGFLSISAKEK